MAFSSGRAVFTMSTKWGGEIVMKANRQTLAWQDVWLYTRQRHTLNGQTQTQTEEAAVAINSQTRSWQPDNNYCWAIQSISEEWQQWNKGCNNPEDCALLICSSSTLKKKKKSCLTVEPELWKIRNVAETEVRWWSNLVRTGNADLWSSSSAYSREQCSDFICLYRHQNI